MKNRYLIALLVLLLPGIALATTDTFTATGSWVAPAGVTSVTAEVWAAGGGGGHGSSGGAEAGGAGGGAYSLKTFSVTPGSSYSYVVGTGGAGGVVFGADGQNGGDSWVCNATINCATIGGSAVQAGSKGGVGVTGSGGGAQIGGSAASGFGDTKFSGGTGANGSGGAGGGGGGGAGSTGNGGNAVTTTGGTGTSIGGGNGGNRTNNGSVSGGGGAGGDGGANGFAGARGQVVLTYTAASAATGGAQHSTIVQTQGTISLKSGTILLY